LRVGSLKFPAFALEPAGFDFSPALVPPPIWKMTFGTNWRCPDFETVSESPRDV
jgi:hypothetical protein